MIDSTWFTSCPLKEAVDNIYPLLNHIFFFNNIFSAFVTLSKNRCDKPLKYPRKKIMEIILSDTGMRQIISKDAKSVTVLLRIVCV